MAEVSEFGRTATGQLVQAVTLRAGDLQAVVLTWGAVLQDLRLAGVGYGLTLGSESLADYEGDMRHHGSVIGPVVNRFSGAKASIGGVEHRFEANQDGCCTLHSGSAGTHLKVWELVEAAADSVTLAVDLPAGEGGFPGNRRIEATYALVAPASLRLTIRSASDALTLMNVTNHSYWNLDGSASFTGHTLKIAADHVLPTTGDFTPTGQILAVAGTEYDFRAARPIAPQKPALDNCFCLSAARGAVRDVLWLQGASGVSMVVATSEPGVQVYDGRNAVRPGCAPYEGIAIEAQLWPDAPNHVGFGSIELAAGDSMSQITEWRFARQ